MIIGSGFDPADFGYLGRLGAATEFGARDDRTINYQVGVGQPYNQTAQAFDLNLGETTRNNNLQSSDRRYNVDQGRAQDLYEFDLNLGETTRNNNLRDATARYGIDETVGQNMYEFNNEQVPIIQDGVPGFGLHSELGGEGVAPVLSETQAIGTQLLNMFPDMTEAQQLQVLDAVPDLTEVGGPDGPVFAQTADAAGELVGDPVNIGTTWNYITPDGEVFLTTDEMAAQGLDTQGNPLPAGGTRGELTGGAGDLGLTNAVTSGVQNNEIALDRFEVVADRFQELLDDPDSQFGVVGWAHSKAQEAIQGIGGVVELIRPEDTGVVSEFFPELYNPNLPALQSLHSLILYMGASALAGQDGRSVSDQDIQRMRETFPTPFGMFSSRNSLQAALTEVRGIVTGYREINQQALGNGVGAGAPDAPAAPAAPDAPAPAPGGVTRLTPEEAQEVFTMQNIRDTMEATGLQMTQVVRQVAERFGYTFEEAMAILQAQ